MEDVAESGGLATALLLAWDVSRDRSMRWRYSGHEVCATIWWVFLPRMRLAMGMSVGTFAFLSCIWSWYVVQKDESKTNPGPSSKSELGSRSLVYT
jgi:hypothetical protein